MPRIVDYETLCQGILDWTHRSDLQPFTDYFIQNAELRIYRDILTQNMGTGIKAMEEQLSGVTDPTLGNLAIPSDYLALKEMQVLDGQGSVATVDYQDPQWIYTRYPIRQPEGMPAFVAREGSNFIFGPFPDQSYTIQGVYYSQGTGLSAANVTTWMVTSAPDVILAASMIEAQPFLKDPDGMSMWTGIYNAKLASLISEDIADRWSSATMQVKVG